MDIAIVKYNAGNIRSVLNAMARIGAEATLTDDAGTLLRADRVIFAGQGEARSTMEYLRAKGLCSVIRSLRQPMLGICVGMQILCRHSEEHDTDCLGIFDVDVKRFRPTRHEDKVPQMGWNELRDTRSQLFRGFSRPEFAYFVHSYYVPLCPDTIATTDYILPYSSALHRDNFYATQFHPEKSGSVGERILRNFLAIGTHRPETQTL